MSAATVRSPLRYSELRRIIAGYTVNRLGTWFGFIALAVVVFDHTHSAVAVAGLLLASQVLPALLVPALVARVEASTRRGELSKLYLFEAATTALLIVLVEWHFSLPAILALVALDGTAALAASALLRAAAARSARDWVRVENPDADEETLAERTTEAERRANAALNIGFAVTFTLGPALAGVVVPTLGASAALLIDLVSFTICAGLLIDLRPHVEDAESESVRARVKAAWQHITEAQVLRRLLLTQAIAFIFFEFSPPIEVAYAKVSLHAGDRGYGVLLGVWGLGVALGSVVFARSIDRSLKVLLAGSTFAIGFAYLGWWLAPTLALASAAGFIGGVGNGVQWAALISAVQRITPENMQGRLMGAVESLGAIFPAFGYIAGSVITIAASPRIALLVAGVGVSICTIAFLRIPLEAKADSPSGSATTGSGGAHEAHSTPAIAWTHPPDGSSAQVEGLHPAPAQLTAETTAGEHEHSGARS